MSNKVEVCLVEVEDAPLEVVVVPRDSDGTERAQLTFTVDQAEIFARAVLRIVAYARRKLTQA